MVHLPAVSPQILPPLPRMQFSSFKLGTFILSSSSHLKCHFLFEAITEISRGETAELLTHSPVAHTTLCHSKSQISVLSTLLCRLGGRSPVVVTCFCSWHSENSADLRAKIKRQMSALLCNSCVAASTSYSRCPGPLGSAGFSLTFAPGQR